MLYSVQVTNEEPKPVDNCADVHGEGGVPDEGRGQADEARREEIERQESLGLSLPELPLLALYIAGEAGRLNKFRLT
jgi:hypothetical protein